MDSGSGGGGQDNPAKVIVLREHQAAERLLDDLLSTDPSTAEFVALMRHAPVLGAPLLAAVARRLDAFDPRSLDVLVRVVAAYPHPDEAAEVLGRAAADRRRADRTRMGAMVALEQALGVRPPDDFLSTLREPVRAATGLLLGALDTNASNPAAMRDYLRALLFQPVDLLYSVLDVLAEVGDERTVDALRLLAIQPDADLQSGAVEALANMPYERALRALVLLEHVLPDDAARSVSRALQKLRLTGVEPPLLSEPDARCRAWLSAVDGSGERLLWMAAPGEEGGITLLGMLLSDSLGVVDSIGTPTADRLLLPNPRMIGRVYAHLQFRLEGGQSGNSLAEPVGGYLEVPYDYAAGLLYEAVRLNWSVGTTLPVEFQLLHWPLWEYAATMQGGSDAAASAMKLSPRRLEGDESDLIFSPLFDSWFLQTEGVRQAAEELAALDPAMRHLPRKLTEENRRALLPLLIKLAHDEFGSDKRTLYGARLRRMAEWLGIAGYFADAQRAVQCAHTMLNSPPEANLFVIRLVEKGIIVALSRRRFV